MLLTNLRLSISTLSVPTEIPPMVLTLIFTLLLSALPVEVSHLGWYPYQNSGSFIYGEQLATSLFHPHGLHHVDGFEEEVIIFAPLKIFIIRTETYAHNDRSCFHTQLQHGSCLDKDTLHCHYWARPSDYHHVLCHAGEWSNHLYNHSNSHTQE